MCLGAPQTQAFLGQMGYVIFEHSSLQILQKKFESNNTSSLEQKISRIPRACLRHPLKAITPLVVHFQCIVVVGPSW